MNYDLGKEEGEVWLKVLENIGSSEARERKKVFETANIPH